MPAMAAAAFARMRAETELMPATSTTEAASSMSLAPTIGRVSPAAIVETISLGTPTGRRLHGLRGDRGVARAARREHAVAAALRVEARDHRRRAARHREHGLTAVAGGPQHLDVRTGGGRDLLAVTSGSTSGGPMMPASTRIVPTPAACSRSRRNAYSRPFVSSVPTSTTVASVT